MQTEFWFHAELHFCVLSHLDLGADAASIYRERPGPARPWVRELSAAYRAAAGRLVVHMLPLVCADLAELAQRLQDGVHGLTDASGRLLSQCVAGALAAEREQVEAIARSRHGETQSRLASMTAFLTEQLGPLREPLWNQVHAQPPPLIVVDCESLREGKFSHGRATVHAGRRIVAVSLEAEREQVVCQVLHEDIHQLTDPRVHARFSRQHPDGPARDTTVGSAGFALHRELEAEVVSTHQSLLEAHARHLLPAYAIWRDRYGC